MHLEIMQVLGAIERKLKDGLFKDFHVIISMFPFRNWCFVCLLFVDCLFGNNLLGHLGSPFLTIIYHFFKFPSGVINRAPKYWSFFCG